MDVENGKNISKEKENTPNIKRDGWETKDIAEQGANESPDEVMRRILRGDDDKSAADNQDEAGSVDSEDTPQGREENKKHEGANKQNG